MNFRMTVIALGIVIVLGAVTVGAEDPFRRGPEERHWTPIADSVYLQETGEQIPTDTPVLSVAVFEGDAYVSLGDGVYSISEGRLQMIPESPGGIHRLRVLGNALWGMADNGLYRYAQGELEHHGEGRFVDICMLRGVVHAATRDDVYRYENGGLVTIEPEAGYKSTNITFIMEDGTQILPRPERMGPLTRIAEYSETLYGLRPNGLVLLDGDVVDPRVVEWGLPPSLDMRDMIVVGSRVYIGTDQGIAVLRGMALTTLDGKDGLPYEDVTCFAAGFDDDLWIGTTWGAARKVDGDFHYFAGQRWLPDDQVRDIAVGDQVVYIATDGGLGVIHYEPYTLQKKAAYYERYLEERGYKRLGFTHKLWHNAADDSWTREITDNDGGYSSHYMTAMAYKYAVTGDAKALEAAVDTFKALVWLEDITPIPGFVARSIWAVGDVGVQSKHGSGGLPARWVPTPDGNFEWKGDTSSDEIGAHYYAMAVFHDVIGEDLYKGRAKRHVDLMTRHIIENGWKLRDMGGELTRWGRWDPEYLQRPYGMYARGLNGMEAQAYAMTAIGLLDNDYFRDGLQQLLDWRYHDYTVRQKITFPPDYITTWDDRLAFMSYYPLIKYVDDPDLRALYMRSLERSWEIKRIEEHPWFNFLYGAITGNDCEADRGVNFLREWPLDLISYSYRNSQRADLHPKPGYVPYAVGPRTNSPKSVSPRESEPKKLDGSTLSLDGGSGGRTASTPNTWLESYWMGRYYGFIETPDTDDPALVGIEDRPLQQLGAAPYAGPPRPEIEM